VTLYYRYGGPVSDEKALTVPCPECGQANGEPCVYIWPKSVDPLGRDTLFRSRAVREQIERVGTPTAKPHNGRRALYSLDEDRGYRLRKMRQLRDWLQAHGDIFEE
jgi:hypothetical protein